MDKHDAHDEPTDLFRPESLSRRTAPLGTAFKPLPIRLWALIVAIALSVVAGLTFLATAQFARRETAAGWLVPDRGAIRIASAIAGNIASVHIVDGQAVDAGTPIVTVLQDSSYGVDRKAKDELLALETSRRSIIERSSSADLSGLQAREQAATARGQILRQQLVELQQALSIQLKQMEIAAQTADDLGVLERQKLVGSIQVREARMNALSQQQAAATLRTRIGDVRRAIVESDMERRLAEAGRHQAIASRARELSQIDQATISIESAASSVISAKVRGRVTGLRAQVGQPVTPDTTLATLLPKGSALIAEVWVPSSAIGFIKPGTTVRLMYDAFPYQKFGTAEANVESVANAPTAPSDQPAGLASSEPLYRVTARLRRSDIDAFGRTVALSPGSRLQADFLLEQRSMLEWLMEPLLAMKRRQG